MTGLKVRSILQYLPDTDMPIVGGDIGDQMIVLNIGNQSKIELTQWDVSLGDPKISKSKEGIVDVSAPKKITNFPKGQNNWEFTVKALGTGVLKLTISNSAKTTSLDLTVYSGMFINHRDEDGNLLEVDLIADVFRGNDLLKKNILLNMLANHPGNYFNENNSYNIKKWKPLACGTVSKVGGIDLMNRATNYDYQAYYRKIKPQIQTVNGRRKEVWEINDRTDVVYDENKLKQGMKAIQKRLKKGMPVITGVTYIPAKALQPGGKLEESGTGGHTVLIVGCNGDGTKFLYMDPYGPDIGGSPRGSILKYTGWLAGVKNPFTAPCEHLGMFRFLDPDYERGSMVLRQVKATQAPNGTFDGNQFLEVVSGPLN
ncbi:MAG: hypothetical protein M3209_09090 [Acidobacteriota bacterium]|nr:hypothetical protein [Acidobacteriota bacterium]